MIKIYHDGETAIISCEVYEEGVLADPSTIKITITNGLKGNKVVDNQDMSKDDVGKYHYDYTFSENPPQEYIAMVTATKNSRISKARTHFSLRDDDG